MRTATLALVVLMAATSVSARWQTNYTKAVEAAKKDGKFLLLDFTGSDWCGWCVKLDREVFKKSAFKKFARNNLVLVELDFPKRKTQSKKVKEQNSRLAQKYNVKGFPTVLLLTPDEQLVATTGYQKGGPENYVKHLNELMAPHRDKVKPAADSDQK